MYDAIVLGVGGVGSAALYHLASRGARVLGLDRFAPGHDRGSSHGRTRIIRQAYFEHADYVPLLLRAYELWQELGERTGEPLYQETGLLEIGPADGVVVPGVLRSAAQFGLSVEHWTAEEIEHRYPGFRVPRDWSGVFERRAGLLHVEQCVRAHCRAAQATGAELRTGVTVDGWQCDANGVEVQTNHGVVRAKRLLVAAGAWSGSLLASLRIQLRVLRKSQFWYAAPGEYHAEHGCPAYLFEAPSGVFYGFPQIDAHGLKVAEHSGGQAVKDPLTVSRDIDSEERGRVEDFLAAHLPRVSRRLLQHQPCFYTMSPDEHFIVDRHPAHSAVCFAAGLSGHGFKFTSVLGEVLADLALNGGTRLPIEFLRCTRPGLG